MSTAPPPDETATDDPWREKYKRWWLQLRGIAWDSMMLDKIMRQNKIVRDTVRRTQDGTLGKPSEGGSGEEGDMGIRIGDEVHNHYSAPAPNTPAPAAGMSTLGKLGIGAALALGGAGLGATVPMAIDAWNNRPSVVDTDTDTDTTVSVSIPEEDRITP